MAFNFLERLGSMFGRKAAEQVREHQEPAAEPAPAPAEGPVAEAAADAPVADAYTPPAADAPTYGPAEVPAPAQTSTTPEPAVATDAPAADTSTYVPVSERAWNRPVPDASTAAPTPQTAPVEPVKSAEELAEERLWAETDAAWAAGDFQKVTESLDALKALQPEDAAEIDQKIAAAQYNQASSFEQAGELDRALYLYQEAQRRNPNLGEAGFAIERVQAALNPPAPAAAPEPAAPAEQSYTVQDGDTLWAIAERYYGDGSQYTRIFDANRDQLDSPDVIQAGQTLRIPS
jgi:nucleoid-associated protein YgaU